MKTKIATYLPTYLPTYLFLLLMFASFNLFGQVKDYEVKLRDKKGNPSLINFKETRVANQTQSVQNFLKQQFKSDQKTEFRVSKGLSHIKKTQSESQKYHQYYNGIKMEHGRLNAISKNGNLTKVVGRYVDVKNLSIIPGISEQQALNFALQHISAETYAWQDMSFEQFLKNEQNDPNATFYPKGELVIVEKNLWSDNPVPRLAFKFNIYALSPLSRAYYYVDAQNGEILLVDAILKHTEGTAQTRYSGTRLIETEIFNGQFRLKDNTRGNGILTLDANHVFFDSNGNIDLSGATEFLDNDNNWTQVEFHNSEKDDAALDAHWGAMMTYDYFKNIHNRNSIDGFGFQLLNYVHVGTNWDNAAWDGQRMLYGDGGILFDALTAIDVIGHEIGHGLEQFTSNLVYQRESGAINESLSDIWGAMVENFAAPEKETYNIGEDISLVFFALRSMSDPHSRNQPDTYGANDSFWFNPDCGTPDPNTNDNCGVHTNSGVMNHWFYLLVEGSSQTDGINDNNDTFMVTGIGKEKAAQIIFYAQTELFMNPGLTYPQASALTIQAAEDLFGAGSLEAFTACQSWFAVGVGDGNCAVEFQITGDDLICSSETYTVTELPPGVSVSWDVTPNLQIVSSTTNSVTVSTSSNGQSGTVFLNVNGSVTGKDVWLGRPASATKIIGPTLVNTGAIVHYSTSSVGGATSYEWRLPYPYDQVSTFDLFGQNWQLLLPANTTNITAFTGYSQQSGLVQVWGKNACGNGGAKTLSVSHGSGGGGGGGGGIPVNGFVGGGSDSGYNVFPNPVNDQLHLVFADNAARKIKLFNFQGVLLKNLNAKSNVLDIDVSSLTNGIYFLEIHQAGGKITEKIIVQH